MMQTFGTVTILFYEMPQFPRDSCFKKKQIT